MSRRYHIVSSVICAIAAAGLSASTRGQSPTTPTTAPGDDVMHPTEHGLHLTPTLAHALALDFVRNEVATPLDLSVEQEQRLSQGIGNSMILATRRNPQATQEFAERMLAMALENHANPQQPTPEQLKDIADRGRPLIPAIRDALDGITQAGTGVLDESQQARLEQMLAHRANFCDSLEQVMERWSRGEVKKTDDPFSEIDDAAGDEWPPSKQWKQRSWAHEQARQEMREIGLKPCEEFLVVAQAALRFDDQQVRRGQTLLSDYHTRVAPIMTLGWRKKVQQYRTRYLLIQALKDRPTAPILFHLDEEYRNLVHPLDELGAKFRADVMAIATDRQRETFLAGIAERAAQYGLIMEDADRALLLRDRPE